MESITTMGANNIGKVPYAVHKTPRNQTANAGRITHDAGMNIAYAVLIVIRERKRLQMIKTGTAHVARYVHFNFAGLIAGNNIANDLHQQYQDVGANKKRQTVHRTERDQNDPARNAETKE